MTTSVDTTGQTEAPSSACMAPRSTRSNSRPSNGPQFVHLVASWLASIPEVDARLPADPSARVADLASGTAWSSIAIARAYPKVSVDAIDVDADSIATARRNVAAAGLTDRVRPIVHDASDPEPPGRYDLLTPFEALHDMNHPVEALRAGAHQPYRGRQRRESPTSEWPSGSPRPGTMRPDTLRRYAHEAGFSRVDVLPIEHDFWRFYRLTS